MRYEEWQIFYEWLEEGKSVFLSTTWSQQNFATAQISASAKAVAAASSVPKAGTVTTDRSAMTETFFDSGRIVIDDGEVRVYLDRKTALNDNLVAMRIAIHLLLNVGRSQPMAVAFLISEGFSQGEAEAICQLFNEWTGTFDDLVATAKML
jgi:hypothetical protein